MLTEKDPVSRTSLLCVLAALPLLSCGAAPLPLRPPPACQMTVYTPTGQTMPLNVQLDVRMSSAFEFVGYCLVLDGASLTTQDTSGNAVAHRAGKLLGWAGDVSRSGPHELMFIAWMRGTGAFEGYRFDVNSSHDFVLTGDAEPAIGVVLRERPGELLVERRPTVEWQPNAAIARPPGWKMPPGWKPTERRH